MKIEIARQAGFCMGVRRAMRLALRAAETSPGPVYTYGPLIHNPQALELLRRLGVEDLREHPDAQKGVVIIRAHGVPPEEKKALENRGFKVLDGTCPRVARVQALARRYAREGYQVIIIGDREHAEVKGILAYTQGRGAVVSQVADLESLPPLEKYVILSQTTQDEELFAFLSQEILSRWPGGKVVNTICHATHERQESIRELATRCEAVVVVGGRGSAIAPQQGQHNQQDRGGAQHTHTHATTPATPSAAEHTQSSRQPAGPRHPADSISCLYGIYHIHKE